MRYHDAKFITSAINKESWPNHDLAEVVLAGRSNVGKSSLINTLCNRKQLAYTGNTPGKTRMLNFFEIDNKIVFVDAPGYGYAKRSFKELEDFGYLMEEYFTLRDNLKALILIVDLRHKPTKDDVMMIDFARSNKVNTIVVATKYDKVKKSEINKQLNVISQTLNVNKENIIQFSSLTRKGYEELWNILDDLSSES
jgi:GTP-binding protein